MTQLLSNPMNPIHATNPIDATQARSAPPAAQALRQARARTRRLVIAAALCMLVAPQLAGAQDVVIPEVEGPQHNTWYTTTISQNSTGFVFTHYWSKGARMRAEVILSGRRIITLVTPTQYYTLDLTRGQGVGVARSQLAMAADQTRLRPFGDEHAALTRGGGEFVSEEELANQMVDVYRLTNDAGRVQIWVTKKLQLPVRVERWNRETGRKDHTDYVDWLRGFPIEDSFFEPPAGLDIEMFEYGEYVSRAMSEQLGPAPPLFGHLLHGEHRQFGEPLPAPKAASTPTATTDKP